MGFVRIMVSVGVLPRNLNQGIMDTMQPSIMYLRSSDKRAVVYPFAENTGEFSALGWLGFEVRLTGPATLRSDSDWERDYSFTVPYWLLLAAAILLPGFALLSAWRRSHRLKLGLCLACGYDLRATPDRCPECGTVARGGQKDEGRGQNRKG